MDGALYFEDSSSRARTFEYRSLRYNNPGESATPSPAVATITLVLEGKFERSVGILGMKLKMPARCSRSSG